MANRNYPSSRIYSGTVLPVLINCNFVVDPANGNGLGIRNLKGAYINNVFMHTTSPLAGTGNPNPAPGLIVVQMTDNFSRYIGGFSGQVTALSGTNTSTLTIGNAYVITSVGASTLAQWQTAGLPVGLTPTVGQSFIALTTSIAGGGLVQAPVASGIDHIETIGDPNQSISPNPTLNQGYGASFTLECLASQVITAPTTGSIISLSFLMNNSSVLIGGQ
jgi:hypothetical protein